MSQSEKELLIKAALAESPSEARCARAFDAWIAEWQITPTQRMLLWNGWQACWRYLGKQVYEEFIER